MSSNTSTIFSRPSNFYTSTSSSLNPLRNNSIRNNNNNNSTSHNTDIFTAPLKEAPTLQQTPTEPTQDEDNDISMSDAPPQPQPLTTAVPQTPLPPSQKLPQRLPGQTELEYQRMLLQRKLAEKSVPSAMIPLSPRSFFYASSSTASTASGNGTGVSAGQQPTSSLLSRISMAPGSTGSGPMNGLPGTATGILGPLGIRENGVIVRANGTLVNASPTDSIMSPCSQKLAKHKNKQFGKTKPLLLSKAFSQAAAAEKDKENVAGGQKKVGGAGLFGAKKVELKADDPIF